MTSCAASHPGTDGSAFGSNTIKRVRYPFSVKWCFEFGRCQPLSARKMRTVFSARFGVTLAAQVPGQLAGVTS